MQVSSVLDVFREKNYQFLIYFDAFLAKSDNVAPLNHAVEVLCFFRIFGSPGIQGFLLLG
jgi:hypothetical protein